MVEVREAIVVEGRYDKNTLSQVVKAPIFETSGFGIMNNSQQLALLRCIARQRGLIVFTDSDGAGFVIRNYLKSTIEPKYLKHAYIPDIPGKEKRKRTAGKAGILGVEGMTPQVILESLRRAGATFVSEDNPVNSSQLTKQDLMELGLSGGTDSKQKRQALCKKLGFPELMSANALLQALSVLYNREQLEEILNDI
jgi:ribonuclease M5